MSSEGVIYVPPKIASALYDQKIIRHWDLVDYCRDAWERNGHTNTCIWGEKGNFKSAFSLLIGFALLKDWDKVLRWTITSLEEFKGGIKEALEISPRRVAWMNLDDVSVYLSTMLYRTHPKLWEKLKTDFTSIRVSLANLVYSAPKKKDVLRLLTDDMNFEVEVNSSKHYTLNGWIQETDPLDRIQNKQRAIQLREDVPFNPYNIPSSIFTKYEAKRLKLATSEHSELLDVMSNEEVVKYSRMPLVKLAQIIQSDKTRFSNDKGWSRAKIMGELSLGYVKASQLVNYVKD